jgi:hypothetical protein
LLLGLAAIFFIPETSDAQIFFRRRRNNYSYNYNSGGNTPVANTLANLARPLVGIVRKRSNRNRSEYDYNWAARRDWHNGEAEAMLFADRVRIKMLLKNETAKVFEDLRVHVSWAYLHKSKTWHTQWVDLIRDGDDVYFDVTGIEEGRVVKIVTDMYLRIDPQPAQPTMRTASFAPGEAGQPKPRFKYLGRMHTPYYGVTTSESNEELKRRARIVSFGLSQWYADEAYGGRYCNYDCYSFFQTSARGELNGFQLVSISRDSVAKLSKQGKRIHGDYLIKPGHFGMALCYDEDTGNLCTLEGNYALSGPYRINIDPRLHGLHTWSSIMTITPAKHTTAKQPAAEKPAGQPAAEKSQMMMASEAKS